MAPVSKRSPRAAFVACAPSLARIHERLFSALGISCEGELGKPGGSCLLLPDVGGVEAFAFTYLASEWLSKLDDGKPSPDKTATTWQRFREAEIHCQKANEFLSGRWTSSPAGPVIFLAQRYIRQMLGRFDWDEVAEGFGWGPGASTRLTRRKSDAAYKYSGTPHATSNCAVLANAAVAFVPLWDISLPVVEETEGVGKVKIVPGNRIVTVPKNYKTDRTIAIEPDMNMYVQKGIGRVLRQRLRQAGCDLDDQSRNQRLAMVGSFAGGLATIDLSMASDTVSRKIVEVLFPPDWHAALGQSRSEFGVLPSGERIFYQKFSSMGNGFTFELESMIFYALALAWAKLHDEEVRRISVYGDDIIVPSRMAPGFCEVLRLLGFVPNEKKSHWAGEFRESCGKHYYSGYDVTPFYVKQPPKTLVDLFKIHNQIWRLQDRWRWLGIERRQELLKVCDWLRTFAPAAWRSPSLLDGLGDGGFVGYFDKVCPRRASRKWKSWDGFEFEVLTMTPTSDHFDGLGLLLKSLHNKHGLRGTTATWTVIRPGVCVVDDDTEAVEILPAKGVRPHVTRVFASSGFVRRQSYCFI